MSGARHVGAVDGWSRRAPRALMRLVGAGVVALLVCQPAAAASLARAQELMAAGQLPAALTAVDEVLASRPGDVEAMLLRGVVLSRLGESDAAIDMFEAISSARPELPEPHNNLAVLFAAQGRYEDARDALLEAVRLQPDYDLAHENLGDVYAKLAALSYARASQTNPSNADAARKSAAAESLLAGVADGTVAAPDISTSGGLQRSVPSSETRRDYAATCATVFGISPPSRATEVAKWLRRRGLTARIGQSQAVEAGTQSYLVYLPSLGSRAEARQQVQALRAAGVDDLIIIARGERENGISLGVYSQREGAQRRMRDLAGLGIDARIEPRRKSIASTVTVHARGAFPATAFAAAFPDLEFSTDDCQ